MRTEISCQYQSMKLSWTSISLHKYMKILRKEIYQRKMIYNIHIHIVKIQVVKGQWSDLENMEAKWSIEMDPFFPFSRFYDSKINNEHLKINDILMYDLLNNSMTYNLENMV